jgi:uncharacterized protein involved in exopolysaccharide biosynthesis
MSDSENKELTLEDYKGILARRWKVFSLVSSALVTVGVVIAFGLPPVYESSGLVLVEQQEVPEYLVRSTVTGYADERLRVITQRVMTRDNLLQIRDAHGLYPELTDTAAQNELKRNVAVEVVQSDVLLSQIGREDGTIAFTVTFGHPSAETAYDVDTDLIDLYLEENQRVRSELAADTSEFLDDQARGLAVEIAAMEELLAIFKRDNADSLPELSDLNLQLMDRTERDVETSEREIRALRETITLLESELAQLSPYSVVLDAAGTPILGPSDRLKLLQRQYLQLSAIYSQDHPDVSKLRREIEALSAQTGSAGINREALEVELIARMDELGAARNRYAPDHPDVLQLQRVVENLQQAIALAPQGTGSTNLSEVTPPDNPLYIQKQVQLEGSKIELTAALGRQTQLRRRLADLESRLMNTPEVERQYQLLSRGYEQLVAQYDDVNQKQREAQIALNLESQSKGERFTLLESPLMAQLPASPNRIAILLLAIIIAVAAGAGGVAIKEATDSTVRGARDVETYLEIPPIVTIPNIYTDADIKSQRLRRSALIAAIVTWLGLTSIFVVQATA